MEILLFLGGLLLAWIILFIVCRTFWLRTIVSMLASAISMLCIISGADMAIAGVSFGISFFFLMGSWFGQKTGDTEVSHEVDLDSRTVKSTVSKPTYTLTMIIMSVIFGAICAFVYSSFGYVAALLPLAVILFKIRMIKLHIANNGSDFDSYDDDGDSDEHYTTRF